MKLKGISREAVLQAISECEDVGREEFLRLHGYAGAKLYDLHVDGKTYDSKAILGVARGYQFPDLGPLTAREFSGGEATVARHLRSLGFTVEKAKKAGRIAVAPTDNDWFVYLSEGSRHQEVNFWTPTPWNVKGLKPGARFYFLLKAPVRKIGGFGTFVRYENRTAREAWNQYGTANGTGSLGELAARASKYAGKNAKSFIPTDNPRLGCIILSDPSFFAPSEYVSPASIGLSFSNQVVKLKYFDHDPLADRFAGPPAPSKTPFEPVPAGPKDYGNGRRAKRPNQGKFRDQVLAAYGGACCITGETALDVLQAAHIQPYVNEWSDHVQNGLALRVDIHALLDAGLISIDENMKVKVSPWLKSPTYQRLDGQPVRTPASPDDCPSKGALQLHREGLFRAKA